MRIFTRFRQMLLDTSDLRVEIERIKIKLEGQDKNMDVVFRCLDELINEKTKPIPRRRIGFVSDDL